MPMVAIATISSVKMMLWPPVEENGGYHDDQQPFQLCQRLQW
jgi:hypothetical protein